MTIERYWLRIVDCISLMRIRHRIVNSKFAVA